MVEVSDTGVGIGAEDREKIFLPFFTTKPSGTGLGMSIVKKIVDLHGGDIAIESTPGRGTRVRIALPAVARPSRCDWRGVHEATDPAGRGRRGLPAAAAPHPGAGGLRRAAGATARRRRSIASRREDVDVVLTDRRLPGMDGVELVRRSRPSIRTSRWW